MGETIKKGTLPISVSISKSLTLLPLLIFVLPLFFLTSLREGGPNSPLLRILNTRLDPIKQICHTFYLFQGWFQNSEGFGIDNEEVVLEAELISPDYPEMLNMCGDLSRLFTFYLLFLHLFAYSS